MSGWRVEGMALYVRSGPEEWHADAGCADIKATVHEPRQAVSGRGNGLKAAGMAC